MTVENPDTKDRVLHAAVKVFAHKGFRDATVAEICNQAGANVSAVNYYYQDKERLYDSVWRYAFSMATEKYPLLDLATGPASPEDQLRFLITSLVSRVLDRGPPGFFARIQAREMVEPTQALEHIVRDVIVPQRKVLLELVDKLFKGRASESVVHLCGYSIVSQCIFLGVSNPVRQSLEKQHVFQEPPVEVLADHIFRFALGGLAQQL